MTNIDDLDSDFIATIIEATAKVRTKDGDIKIINISEQAEHLLSDFNAYAYLSVPQQGDG